MTSPTAVSSGGGAHRWLALGALVVVVAACSGPAGSPSAASGTPAPASAEVPATPAAPASEAPSASAEATADPGGSSEPPAALLIGTDAGPVAGDLGTFSWDGLVSDSPWIVQRSGNAAAAGARLRVRFDDSMDQTRWTARWAPIRRGEAGTPRAAGSGDEGRILIEAPAEAGSWSLQLEARFGDGRRAAWYWRVAVDG
ncbi:MAG TPA: hypothetical protein VIZ22_06095 [Candidatus Limnocylindrales bacterium]